MILAVVCLPLLFAGCEKRIVETGVTIYGTVYDAATHNPIQGAMLTVVIPEVMVRSILKRI